MKNRVCFPGSLYVLTFYLLMSTKEEIEKTIYFVDKNIQESVRNNLKNVVYLDEPKSILKNKYINALYSVITNSIRYPQLRDADIYGLDFKYSILRGHKMKYIEDAPFVFDLWETSPLYKGHCNYNNSLLKKFVQRILLGNYYQNPVATCDDVTDVYTSTPVFRDYLVGKQIHVVDLRKMWLDSDSDKKQLILSVFGINKSILESMRERKYILLTQAFYDDKFVTEEEQIEIYRKIISNYPEKDILIKPHPRDRIDYRKYFPKSLYFDKVVAMQFLAILGVSFERVITVSSSSALSFGLDVPIDWYGYEVHPGILRGEGVRTLEQAVLNYKNAHGQN